MEDLMMDGIEQSLNASNDMANAALQQAQSAASSSSSAAVWTAIGTIIAAVVVLVIYFLLCNYVRKLAIKKGHDGVGFFIFAFFQFIPALVVVLCIKDKISADLQPKNGTVADELIKYKQLVQMGSITQQEFEMIKFKLIYGMTFEETKQYQRQQYNQQYYNNYNY